MTLANGTDRIRQERRGGWPQDRSRVAPAQIGQYDKTASRAHIRRKKGDATQACLAQLA